MQKDSKLAKTGYKIFTEPFEYDGLENANFVVFRAQLDISNNDDIGNKVRNELLWRQIMQLSNTVISIYSSCDGEKFMSDLFKIKSFKN